MDPLPQLMQFPPTDASPHTVSNGLTVITQVDRAAPVISAQCWIATGSQHEQNFSGSGLSHLLEHMVFKGTDSFTGPELATRVNSAGGQWNAYTSLDRTVYYIDGPSTACDTFVNLLFELVFLPRFPEEDFETEREVIRREIDMGRDDPDSAASQLLFRTFFQHDPRRHPVIGHRTLFDALRYEDMTNYHHQRYIPSNSIFVLSGDFDRAAVLSNLEQLSGSLPGRALSHPNDLREPRQLGLREARKPFSIPTSRTTLAWQTPGLDHPDVPALELLSGILGGGRSSHLYRRFHEEEGLAHYIGTWSWNPADGPGMFSISAEVDHDRRDHLEQAILGELTPALEGELQPSLDKARRQIFARQFKSLTTASGRATDLASNWHEARNLNFTRDYLDLLDQVTANDVVRVARQYLRPDGITITSLDPHEAHASPHIARPTNAPGEITTQTLDNGLTLVLRPDPRVPIVQFQGVFRTGRLVETPENCGINPLHASLLTKGTADHPGGKFAGAVEALGATLRASAGNNTSILSSFCLKADLATVLGLSGEALGAPAFQKDTFLRERDVQLADLRESMEDPLKTAFRLLRGTLFGNQHYGLPRLGTEASLAQIDCESLLEHHHRFMTRQNGVLAIFGDINPKTTADLCERIFGSLPEGSICEPSPETSMETYSGETSQRLAKEQAVIAIGYPGAHITSGDIPALELIHEYCANMAGPLFTRLREELGLAYYVNATQFHGLGRGLFAFYAGTAPDQADLARRELLTQIEILTQEGIPEQPLAHAKTSILASDALENQSSHSMAQVCALNSLFGLGPLHHLKHAERVKSITGEEILATAQRYFGRDPVIATVSP